ncbi:MAG: hypothetical protein HN936_13995 [Bacteroidetes bacterium]|nr:hypothetical protein [Bacteroidota bacterium]
MNITINNGLPFTNLSLVHNNKELILESVLIDTGSAGSIFDVDDLAKIDLLPEPEDEIHNIVGVGGNEFVIQKRINKIQLGEIELFDFSIEIGAVDYGFNIQGSLGFDFLFKAKVIIDLSRLQIRSQARSMG